MTFGYKRVLSIGILAVGAALAQQSPHAPAVDQADAQRTKEEFSQLLERYPPSLRNVLSLDPTLLGNSAYLGTYPALAAYLTTHPEIAHNPSFYVPGNFDRRLAQDRSSQVMEMWRSVFETLGVFTGFGMGLAALGWLIRTMLDYRRWNRLSKVQTEVHTKLLDRFTANDEMLAYIQSPAGSKFLESTPITLDAGPRSLAAPMGRILWSMQAGLVLMALGIGFVLIGANAVDEAAQPLRAVGVLALAVGVGFVGSAVVSFLISRKLGLIEPQQPRQ